MTNTLPTPNIENFNKAFEAARNNPKFDMSDCPHCFWGSMWKNWLETPLTVNQFFYIDSKDNDCGPYIMSWFTPLSTNAGKYWPDKDKFTDVEYCITNVKKIVDEFHGPQDWEN